MDTTAWLAEQIEAHTPDKESDPQAAHRIAEAYAALAGAAAPVFGMQTLPPDITNRDALRARALEVMKQWLAKLEPEEKDKLRLQLAGYGIGSAPAPTPVPTDEPAK